MRIRQGSPQEEAALAQHLRELAVSPRQAQEMGQLAELLILLGEFASIFCWVTLLGCHTSLGRLAAMTLARKGGP